MYRLVYNRNQSLAIYQFCRQIIVYAGLVLIVMIQDMSVPERVNHTRKQSTLSRCLLFIVDNDYHLDHLLRLIMQILWTIPPRKACVKYT